MYFKLDRGEYTKITDDTTTWRHVAVVRDTVANTLTIYADGV